MRLEFTEKEVIIKGEYELSATLTTPQGKEEKYPAIVLINGSGGANRDGNMKGFDMNIYKELAEYVASIGFVTIRYDKRGIGKSKGDPHKAGMKDLMDDVISNVKYLQGLPEVDADKIILMGHSEGCILATIANSQYPVAGLVLIAGAGIAIKTAMQGQNYSVLDEIKNMKGIKGALLRALLSEKKLVAKQNKLFDMVSASTEDVIKIQFTKFPAKWLREHLSYSDNDILNMLKATSCPVLAVTGDKDVQANSEDLKAVEALHKENIRSLVLKDMDHILREYKGSKSIMNLKKQYKAEANKTINPELKEELESWLVKNFI